MVDKKETEKETRMLPIVFEEGDIDSNSNKEERRCDFALIDKIRVSCDRYSSVLSVIASMLTIISVLFVCSQVSTTVNLINQSEQTKMINIGTIINSNFTWEEASKESGQEDS